MKKVVLTPRKKICIGFFDIPMDWYVNGIGIISIFGGIIFILNLKLIYYEGRVVAFGKGGYNVVMVACRGGVGGMVFGAVVMGFVD